MNERDLSGRIVLVNTLNLAFTDHGRCVQQYGPELDPRCRPDLRPANDFSVS